MRTLLAATVGAALLLMVPSAASADMADCSKKLESRYSWLWHHVDRRSDRGELRRDAAGRNIRHWGKKYKGITFDATCPELRKSAWQLKKLYKDTSYVTLVRTAVPPTQRPGDTFTASVGAGPVLQSIAQCESGGNPSTDTGNGFYGKYQFTLSTWQSVGGSGNPAQASEAEQDYRAAKLYAQAGPAPWPVCGH
jgi:transglycosylase-like protein